jgi:hypothetical protein
VVQYRQPRVSKHNAPDVLRSPRAFLALDRVRDSVGAGPNGLPALRPYITDWRD